MNKYLATLLLTLCTAPAFAAGEIQLEDPLKTGETLYVVIKNASGNALTTGTTFATYTSTRGDFDQALTEVSGTGLFTYTFPAVTAGNYKWTIYQDADDNGTPAFADDIALADGQGFWNGSAFGADVLAVGSDTTASDNLERTYNRGGAGYGPVLFGGSVGNDVASNTAFELDEGVTFDDAYNGATVYLRKAATGSTYTGNITDTVLSNNRITVSWHTVTPTVAENDLIEILPGYFSRVTLADTATTLTEDITGLAAVSPFLVAKGHSWRFDSPGQVTAPQLIREVTGFDDVLFEMDFSGALSNSDSIGSVSSVTVTDISGTEPTVVSSALRADKKAVHIKMDGASASANTYTVTVTIVTADSQTITRKGRMVVE